MRQRAFQCYVEIYSDILMWNVDNNQAHTEENRSSEDLVLEMNIEDTMDSKKEKHRSNGRSLTTKAVGQHIKKITGCLHWSHEMGRFRTANQYKKAGRKTRQRDTESK